jgi:hypothetical protein
LEQEQCISYELSAIVIYFLIVLAIGYFSYRKSISADDFIIGKQIDELLADSPSRPCQRYEQLALF